MNAAEKLARLRLIRTENVGPVTFARLVARFGTAARALEALPSLASRGGRAQPLSPFPADAAAREIDRLEKHGARLIALGEDLYPPLLAQIDDAPPLIAVLGDPVLLSKPALAVVGARNASLSGRRVAADFSARAGAEGFMIVSGLARGIDSAAHEAALDTGTVAVVAGGIDVVYPPENEKLYRAIRERGAVVAESPFGTEPLARHFPRRNRIISGLSLALLVAEAALKSGSLITARMALEQNRDLLAVPGSPLDPRAAGANALLRDGAYIAAEAEDVLRVLRAARQKSLRDGPRANWQGPPALLPAEDDAAADPSTRTRVVESLNFVPMPVDTLIRAVGAPTAVVLAVLLELELAGRVERQAGGLVNLI